MTYLIKAILNQVINVLFKNVQNRRIDGRKLCHISAMWKKKLKLVEYLCNFKKREDKQKLLVFRVE